MKCQTCGEETEFWKSCTPRMTNQLDKGEGKTPKKMRAMWYKCPHCGFTQVKDVPA